jgi:hypothetical protein
VRAHRVKVHIVPNQPLQVELPANLPETDAEVIVLIPDIPPGPQGERRSLREFTEWLEHQPSSGRTKEEIDSYLAEERASWD